MSELEFLRIIRKSGSPDTRCSKKLTLRKFFAPESWCSGKGSAQESQKNLYLILIILGSVQVSVQMEQENPENEISPASTSDKDASIVSELEPEKEWIQLKEIGKNEKSGK